MKILLIDNYDSFVYNIVGLLELCRKDFPELTWELVRNDKVRLNDIKSFDAIILSPGPGVPSEAGKLLEVIRQCCFSHPMLGVCLGCQAIAEVFGGHIRQLDMPRHGHRTILREVDRADWIVGFCNEGNRAVGRYHSWVIDEASLDESVPLVITARDEEGNVMALRHKRLPIFGVQFHPESIITDCGEQMLRNFLLLSKEMKWQAQMV